MSFDDNILLLTDSYKATHWRQYPPDSETVYSYFESRGGKFDEVVFFGLQYYLKRFLEGCVVTRERIDRAEAVWNAHLADPTLFNRAGWEHILKNHGGRLPVAIRAVPEGTPVPTRNVMMTIENTDPACYWLTNYLETLLVQVWYGSTVATLSREMKRLVRNYLKKTGTPEDAGRKLHDFGFRGVSSVESAALGAAAHLLSFQGTDTIVGCLLAEEYYDEPMAGFSIPASEHSTITSWGDDGERAAFANMLAQYPSGVVACVSDSYDIYRACSEYWGRDLKDKILKRDGTLVVRPDSGDPTVVVCKVLEVLEQAFGAVRNAKGYKVLPPQVRVIQGDGVDYAMAQSILYTMQIAGWSADNVAFGMGGGLLQKLNRDTQKFAFKCSEITRAGQNYPVFKDPVTDPGKRSKRGQLKLVRTPDGFETRSPEEPGDDLLVEVFRDGEIQFETRFADIRNRAQLND